MQPPVAGLAQVAPPLRRGAATSASGSSSQPDCISTEPSGSAAEKRAQKELEAKEKEGKWTRDMLRESTKKARLLLPLIILRFFPRTEYVAKMALALSNNRWFN